MGIEFNHCLQTSILGESAKVKIFEKAHELSKSKSGRIGLGIFSLATGLGLAAITLTTKVNTVGEIIFKGIANIGGGLLGKEGYSATLGAKQLGIALPAAIIDLILGAPIHMAYNLIGDTYGIAARALGFGNYTKTRLDWHEGKVEQLVNAATSNSLRELSLDDEHLYAIVMASSLIKAAKSVPALMGQSAMLCNFIIYGNGCSLKDLTDNLYV